MKSNARPFAGLVFLVTITAGWSAQPRVVPTHTRHRRVIALVHLTGSGKHGDPLRPEFAPLATGKSRDDVRTGIVAWTFQLTDDKKMAIVHFAAENPAALQALRNDRRPEIRVFEIGKDRPDRIEAEMRKYKKDFRLNDIELAVP